MVTITWVIFLSFQFLSDNMPRANLLKVDLERYFKTSWHIIDTPITMTLIPRAPFINKDLAKAGSR